MDWISEGFSHAGTQVHVPFIPHSCLSYSARNFPLLTSYVINIYTGHFSGIVIQRRYLHYISLPYFIRCWRWPTVNRGTFYNPLFHLLLLSKSPCMYDIPISYSFLFNFSALHSKQPWIVDKVMRKKKHPTIARGICSLSLPMRPFPLSSRVWPITRWLSDWTWLDTARQPAYQPCNTPRVTEVPTPCYARTSSHRAPPVSV